MTTVFPIDFVARANYALTWDLQNPINFTRQLSKPLIESHSADGTIDVSKYVSPEELPCYLERLNNIENQLKEQGSALDEVLRLSFQDSAYSAQFTDNFDYTYRDMSTEDMLARVDAGQSRILETIEAKMQELKAPITLVSIGCGDGKFNAKYAPLLPADSRLLLIDLHPSALVSAVRTVRQSWPNGGGAHSISEWKQNIGGIYSLPFDLAQLSQDSNSHIAVLPPGSVDFIESCLCLHHVADMLPVFREVKRVLNPATGVFVFFDPFDHTRFTAEDNQQLRFPTMPLPSRFHGIEFFRTLEETKEMLQEAGLKVVEMERVSPAQTFFKCKVAE